ncbi:hypothetical protein Taro_020725 [Colocasia esculenta]|uniref:Uncharacterized protein n=1 Tax=Colocasia esculenta TaxID=4460 RepID=A0A843V2Y1_COLES|nr:hypothetical protein [Colocasia esculenta]
MGVRWLGFSCLPTSVVSSFFVSGTAGTVVRRRGSSRLRSAALGQIQESRVLVAVWFCCTPSCKMVLGETAHISLGVVFFGMLAFIFGVVAETKKPASGIPIRGKGGVICQYPSDPSILLGSLAVVALFITTLLGLVSIFYPYHGKPVPGEALFRSTTMRVFFAIALGVTALADGMMLWATVTEGLHRDHNVHQNPENQCPTAKTGIFGGAAFLALDAMLFWLVCQMLALNARADHLLVEDEGDHLKGEYSDS